MNHREHDELEAEMQRLRPAEPPRDLLARLAAIRPPESAPHRRLPQPVSLVDSWWLLLRQLAPATAAVVLTGLALVWWRSKPDEQLDAREPALATRPGLKPDDVQIDRRLIAAYDALAQMPGGEPVRVRCQEWMDEVVLRDSARGVQIEQRTPRLEIVSVSLDTY